MASVVWTGPALEQLRTIHLQIARDNPSAAARTIQRIIQAVARLSAFPMSSRVVPEQARPDIREIIVRPYRIVFRVRPELVEIVTV